jgi:hypothetical protein
MKHLFKFIIVIFPIFLFSETLSFSQECFLIENDTTSPSLIYDLKTDKLDIQTDTSLRMFTDPNAYYNANYQRYSKKYRLLQELYAQFPDAASLRDHFYHENATILYQNNTYISLQFTQSAYTGGAHPNFWSKHWIIDASSGKIIEFDELFSEKDIDLLKQLSDREIKKIFHTETLENLLFTDDYKVSEDIYLLKNGVVFQYDPYEIAPYSTGSIRVFIPFRKLKQTKINAFIQDRHK